MKTHEYDDLLFGVRRSIRYHSRRQAFFEGVNRWTNFLLLLFGSGTVALAVQDRPSWILGLGLGVALVSSLKLVFAFAVKATQHARFVRDFTLLEKRLRADASEETVRPSPRNVWIWRPWNLPSCKCSTCSATTTCCGQWVMPTGKSRLP